MNKKISTKIAMGIILIAIVVVVGIIYLTIKEPENNSSPASFKLGKTKILKSQTIDSVGGEIKIENSQTPLDGFIITIPAGAIEKTADVLIGYNDGYFANLPAGSPTGKTIVLTIKGPGVNNLNYPITISFPFSRMVVGYAIDPDGSIEPITTSAYEPRVINETFHPETIITWVTLN